MPLDEGARVGTYRIISPIGKGGMGEVYRAKDTRLERDVAIKVLPDELAASDERAARFEREAKLLASLNHPNIASIHGFEDSDGVKALVLELVEGPTLAERIARGPIPVDETVAITEQVAAALEAGHEAGVIHRDLKPANVKVRDDGTVKVLDYGLAKALEADVTVDADGALSQSPTLTRQGTQFGVILGTAAYMSPEQAKGKRVDKRTDIFAFGALLYEMLTAKRAFEGEDVSETLASILKSDPDWSRLPGAAPARLGEILRRCTAKDPSRRLRDIGDARLELLSLDLKDATSATSQRERKSRVSPAVVAAALSSVVAAGFLAWIFKPATPFAELGGVARVSVNLPSEQELYFGSSREAPPFAISPDGRTIAYTATEDGVRRLYLRSLDAARAERIEGTEGALSPFFSPDGGWVGYFSGGALEKLSLSNRLPVTLCQTSGRGSWGASWAPSGTIVFTSGERSGLYRVSADGGEPEPLTSLDEAQGDLGHLWPVVAGDSVLYTIRRGSNFDFAIGSVDLTTGVSKVVLEGARHAIPTRSGHLVYGASGGLVAAPFDLSRSEVTGPAIPVGGDVHSSPGGGARFLAVSDSGMLIYASRPSGQLVWVDRKGALEAPGLESEDYVSIRLSVDGGRLAYGGRSGIWVLDLERGTTQHLADGGSFPVWRAGTDEVTVFLVRDGLEQMFSVKADGSEEPRRLLESPRAQAPKSWSPDGSVLLYNEINPDTQFDLWTLHEDGTSSPFVVTPANENDGRFSPDGKHIAYESDESGELEIYVRDYPAGERQWVVSSRGGEQPVWSRDGKELFFRQGEYLLSAPVESKPVFRIGRPKRLFKAPSAWGVDLYDVAPDGEHFIMVRGDAAAFHEIHVVLNWTSELERLVPSDP